LLQGVAHARETLSRVAGHRTDRRIVWSSERTAGYRFGFFRVRLSRLQAVMPPSKFMTFV
jgi:hypothetical protein